MENFRDRARVRSIAEHAAFRPGAKQVVLASVFLWLVGGMTMAQSPPDTGWPHYGNDAGGARYSSLAQINRSNVAQLRVAWTFHTGALLNETYLNRRAAFESTPLLVDGKLFLSTPYDHVIALDPQSGNKLWEYDPGIDLTHGYAVVTSRGVAAWRDTAARPDTPRVSRPCQ